MAFTEGEKYKIIRFLGWNGGTLTPSNIYYSKNVADKLATVPAGAETEARDLLTKISAFEAKEVAAVGRDGVRKIDDIEFFEGGSNHLRKAKNRFVSDLSAILGIPVMHRGSGIMGDVLL